MLNRKLFKLAAAVLILAAALSLSVTGVLGQDGAVFKGAWPFTPLPQGHFNTFVTDSFALGIYQDLLEPASAFYLWASDSWQNVMATGWEIDGENFLLRLRDDCTWSDGSAFGAADAVATFNILRLQNNVLFRYVDNVTAVDDHTVSFHMFNPSSVMPRYVLRTRIAAASTYGDIAGRAQALFDAGKTRDDSEWQDLIAELNAYRPEKFVTSGPFTLDMADITDTQVTLHKRADSCLSPDVKFDSIVLYNGETPTVTPLVMNREVYYATHGFPPATELAFDAMGIRILRPPIYSGPALFFNYAANDLFTHPEFRQAIAYAVDRDQNGAIALGRSGKRQIYMAGFSDNLLPNWLTDEQLAALNHYDHNPAKADELLSGLGLSRGADGKWQDADGNPLSFELSFPAEFADWSGAAQNLADQLNAYGLGIELRGVQFQQHDTDVRDGNFTLAIRGWGAGNPHPSFAYDADLRTYNTGTGGTQRPGMSFPLTQTVNGQEVDLDALAVATASGMDVDAQKAATAELAAAYNYLLPQIPLWERYGNNPAFPGITWPPDDDPVYINSPYSDSFVVLMILDGRLGPA
jgi:peptide/nickel transport system substrate-binding protein